jgi:16S rRNA (guanine527-N7)-methyltransferase
MNAALQRLAQEAQLILERPLSDGELTSFQKYLLLLQKWQRSQRLMGSAEPDWIVHNLFLDSLLFLRVLPRDAAAVADVGSGAGLPGVPLAIVRPAVAMTLIESRERRVSFLSAVVRELPLPNTRVVRARVEGVASTLRQQFDAVVMRCAGDFAQLARSAAELVRPGGCVIASAPPASSRRRLSAGLWVEVPGLSADRLRGFAVHMVEGKSRIL